MKTFKFSLVLRTRENTDVFISFDDNIYGIHSKRINILYLITRLKYDGEETTEKGEEQYFAVSDRIKFLRKKII